MMIMMGWSTYLVTLFLLCISSLVNCNDIPLLKEDGTILVHANWNKTPFKLNVLEAVSEIDESLYEPLVLKLLGIEYDVETEEYNLIEDFDQIDDTSFYNFAISFLKSDSKKFFADVDISNVLKSPRIQAHYNYYESVVKSKHGCQHDSVIFEPIGANIYCDKDAAFMLQNHNQDMFYDDYKLKFDRVFGSEITPKTYFIYGDFKDETFRVMFFNMYQFVASKKINLVWRYVNSHPSSELELLSGYFAELALEEPKRFINIDSIRHEMIENIFKSDNPLAVFEQYLYDLPETFSGSTQSIDIKNKTLNLSLNLPLENNVYINNVKMDKNMDILELIKTIKDQVIVQEVIRSIGVTFAGSIKALKEFAMVSANNEDQFNQRYDIINLNTVVYLNDIEKDERYSDFEPVDYIYQSFEAKKGLPKVKQNIHKVIFYIDITQPDQISKLLNFYDYAFKNHLPIQVGIIPSINEARNGNKEAISKLYGTSDTLGRSKTHSYLLMLQRSLYSYDRLSERIFDELMYPDAEESSLKERIEELQYAHQSYHLTHQHPHIIVNGIFYQLEDYDSIMGQLMDDAAYLHEQIMEDKIPLLVKLKTHLGKESVSFKDDIIFPLTIDDLRAQFLVPPGLKEFTKWNNNALKFSKSLRMHQTLVTINLVGYFNNPDFIRQIHEAIVFVKETSDVKLVVYDRLQSKEFEFLKGAQNIIEQLNYLDQLKSDDNNVVDGKFDYMNVFGNSCESGKNEFHLIIAGRKIKLNRVLLTNQFASLIHYERSHRLNFLWKLYQLSTTSTDSDDEFVNFELFSWAITYAGYQVNIENFIADSLVETTGDIHTESQTELVNLKVVVDIVLPESQKLLPAITLLKDQDFVSIDVYFTNKTNIFETSIKWVKHNINTKPLEPVSGIKFSDAVYIDDVYIYGPSNWLLVSSSSKPNEIVLELENIIVEGHINDVDGATLSGIPIQVKSTPLFEEETFFSAPELGYVQLKLNPGQWEIGLAGGTDASIIYELSNDELFEIIDYEKIVKTVELKKKKFMEKIDLYSTLQQNASFFEKMYFNAQKLLNSNMQQKPADVNIFSVPYKSGEQILSTIESVTTHTKSSVSFWIYEKFISFETKSKIQTLANEFGFEYHFVNYQWPTWLPEPHSKKLYAWGIKTLFLDSLFPSNLENVIVIEAGQIVRSDIKEMTELLFNSNVFAMSAIPKSNAINLLTGLEKEGWANYLNAGHEFYNSDLFVVNLSSFKAAEVGKILRTYYKSFFNVYGDAMPRNLPNKLQDIIKIQSISDGWSWCNNWFDADLVRTAKTVGICSDASLPFSSLTLEEIEKRQSFRGDSNPKSEEKAYQSENINHDEL